VKGRAQCSKSLQTLEPRSEGLLLLAMAALLRRESNRQVIITTPSSYRPTKSLFPNLWEAKAVQTLSPLVTEMASLNGL